MLIYIKLEIFKIEQEYFDVYSLLPQRYHNLILKSWCLIDTQNPPVLVSRIILWNNWLDLSTVNCRTNSFLSFFFFALELSLWDIRKCLSQPLSWLHSMPFTSVFFLLLSTLLSYAFKCILKIHCKLLLEHCTTKWIWNKLIQK